MAEPIDADLPDNWGRWGADDELGTLNLITGAVRVKAAAEVRAGRWASLAQPVITDHYAKSTRIEAPAHWSEDDEVYPGRPRAGGATTAFAAGIVTRGVLLDLVAEGPLPAEYVVTSYDFDEAERREGVSVSSGDALVIRLGWSSTRISVDAVRWMHRRGVALCASDSEPSPLPGIAVGRMAMPLIAAAELDDLAALCAELDRYSFLLTFAPPRIHGQTRVPVNPLALF